MTDYEQTAYIPRSLIGNGEGVREERPALDINNRHSLVSSMVEHRTFNPGVAGSIPARGTR